MSARTPLLAVIATLMLMLGPADSFAQFGSKGGVFGGSRGGNRDQGKGSDYRRPGQQDNDSYEQTEYRLSLLEEDLRLQSTQRAPWESFAGKVRAYAGDLAREKARAMAAPSAGNSTTGVQHIEQAADTARNHATALEDIAAAAKTLYAGLTPEQKFLADARIITIVAPPPRAAPAPGSGSNLPDLGSSSRPSR